MSFNAKVFFDRLNHELTIRYSSIYNGCFDFGNDENLNVSVNFTFLNFDTRTVKISSTDDIINININNTASLSINKKDYNLKKLISSVIDLLNIEKIIHEFCEDYNGYLKKNHGIKNITEWHKNSTPPDGIKICYTLKDIDDYCVELFGLTTRLLPTSLRGIPTTAGILIFNPKTKEFISADKISKWKAVPLRKEDLIG